MNELLRFQDKISHQDNGCVIFVGAKQNGYGVFRANGKAVRAHRWIYELVKGKVPEGLELDHLCGNRACVNPDHLEPVTRRINLLRSPITITSISASKTHCPSGHPYDSENTILFRNERRCRICYRTKSRDWKRRKRNSELSWQ